MSGVRTDPGDPTSVVSSTTAGALEALVDSGAIVGGMIPKARACARAVRHGVEAGHILDGRVEHALLLELFTESGVGTMVVGS